MIRVQLLGSEEDAQRLVQPQSAGWHGAKPELIKLPSFHHETDYLIERLQQLHERGIPWNELAIVYRVKWMAEQIYDRCHKAHMPVEWLHRDQDSQLYDAAAPSVKLVTMHSSRGLEFAVVCVPGVAIYPQTEYAGDEAHLLYVAMTRAIDPLVLTCDRDSEFVQRLERTLDSARSTAFRV